MIFVGFLWLAVLSLSSAAQDKAPVTVDSVLETMDATAAHFQTAQADFVWDQYQKVVDETDTQKGTVYYRRSGQQIEMMADIKEPDRKYVLYKEGKLQVYQPKIEQVIEYSAGANHSEIESYLVLGFGGSGQDLKKSFDVTFQGEETIDNIATAKLQLIPKSEKVRNYFSEAYLWIDLSRGVSIQQKFMQGQGDYRLAKYSAVNLHAKIGNDVFRLKTTSKTKTLSPRG
ncbi:MAG TPA: outer membrane lipoprotein carrier protein LolA [Candidatus Sulfotelmatobacter sp.]|nr:outer membrane lipoprotein carrier protein LolA [Candidatus Sulfotelmatobacter sp.]